MVVVVVVAVVVVVQGAWELQPRYGRAAHLRAGTMAQCHIGCRHCRFRRYHQS